MNPTMPEDVVNMSESEKQLKDDDVKLRKKIKETLKSIDAIHPAGMVCENFAIEPIAPGRFIYNVCNVIGEASCELNYDSKKWFIKIEGEEVLLDGKPLDKSELVFNLPDKDVINQFIKKKIQPLTAEELYIKSKEYFKRFVDLSDECYYDGLVLGAFQSWLLPVLNSVFFHEYTGQFGGGKTTIMKSVKHLARHGYCPDPSVAFIGRCLDRLKVTPFIDEFDKLGEQDNQLYRIIRETYCRGAVYTRMAEKGQKLESFNVFGMVGFTVHGTIEDALQQRALPIYTTVTSNNLLPRMGKLREHMGNKLYNAFFIWYIRKIVDIYNAFIAQIAQIAQILDNNNLDNTIDKTSDDKLLSIIQFSQDGQFGQFGQLEGRNIELQQVILEILHYLGFLDSGNNLGKSILESGNRLLMLKEEIKEEMRETGVNGIIREWLVNFYKRNRNDMNYRTSEGLFMASNQELYEGLGDFAKGKGYQLHIPPSQYRGIMRDFGWAKGKNEKKMMVWLNSEGKKTTRLAFIFDDRIQRNISIKIDSKVEVESFDKFTSKDKGVEHYDVEEREERLG